MAKKQAYYKVPVYKFDEATTDSAPQTTTENAAEYVSVEHVQRPFDESELRVIHVAENQRETYRFRVKNDILRRCGYRGNIDDLPIHIQHAVTAYGYGDDGLAYHNNPLSLWMETNGTLNLGMFSIERFQSLPIIRGFLEIICYDISSLKTLLLARYALSEEVYLDCWRDVNEKVPIESRDYLERVVNRFESKLADTDVSMLQSPNGGKTRIPVTTDWQSVTANGNKYLLVDLISKWGSSRFQFQVIGDDRCVFEGLAEIQIPPPVVIRLQKLGYHLTNRPSIVYASKPGEIFRRHVDLCDWLDQLGLIPDFLDGRLASPIHESRMDALVQASILEFIEDQPDDAIRLHTQISDKYAIDTPDDLTRGKSESVIADFLDEMPVQYDPFREERDID
jgi:hypothetical protein